MNCLHFIRLFTAVAVTNPTYVSANSRLCTSDEGPKQGDPLGPLLFCCTAMSLVQRIKSEFNVWYMDDGTLGGNFQQLLDDFQMLVEEGGKLGLVVNAAKCELITDNIDILDKFRAIAPDIKHVQPTTICSNVTRSTDRRRAEY